MPITENSPKSQLSVHGKFDSPVFWRRKLFWIVAVGFLLRLAFILIAHTYRIKPAHGNFGFGWEMGRIAKSLVEGHGYGNPFEWPTGPTAWEPPLYPFLMAGIYKLFGVYTRLSGFVLLAINSMFSALTAIPVFYLARRSFGTRIAKWSAWTWTLFPYCMYWAVKWIWETSITAFLLTCLVLLTIRLSEGRRLREWLAWGALWGIGALLNPSILSLLPFAGLWAVVQLARARKQWLVPVVLSAITFFAVITPWLIRNYRTFGQPVFLRTNLGAEFRMGNGPSADGTWMYYLHPTHNVLEFAKYKRMGELAYVAQRKREALDWIKSNPAKFVKVSIARFVYYWINVPPEGSVIAAKNFAFLASSVCGWWGLVLVWKQRRPAWFLYAAAMIFFPLVYYFVFPHPRYRAPIEPLMTILVVFLISQTSNMRERHPELEP